MSESMASHDHMDQNGQAEPLPAAFEVVTNSEMGPRGLVEKFLSECSDESLQPREELATFILAALSDDTSAESTRELQAVGISPDDEQFDTLIATDVVFRNIFDLLIKTKKIVGRGEPLSLERRALIKLMGLRAGEVIMSGGSIAEESETSWELVLTKLFPDLA